MELFLTSVIAFTSTNIDDIFILTLFFGDKRYKTTDIYLGQYVGVILLIGVSVIGSFIGNFIDSKYIGLLGLFPIYLGLRQIWGFIKKENKEEEFAQKEKDLKTGILTVATVTFANGGDNIGTYTPLFATLTTSDKLIMVTLFLVMVLIWPAIAQYLRRHPIWENLSPYRLGCKSREVLYRWGNFDNLTTGRLSITTN
jgi:cadmium resistance protein CadD (predicted permease)